LDSLEPTTKEPFAPGALYEFESKQAAGIGDDGEVIVEQAPVSFGREPLVTNAGDHGFFFGWRSDPFFFDVNGNFQSHAVNRRGLLQRQNDAREPKCNRQSWAAPRSIMGVPVPRAAAPLGPAVFQISHNANGGERMTKKRANLRRRQRFLSRVISGHCFALSIFRT
jgi:hypothetical protein